MVSDGPALARTVAAFAAGRGPVAVDAERASGYRYSARAYLVQLRRSGVGTALVDPLALGSDLSRLGAALADAEWVLHAASQDLACLAEVGMVPNRLFDTELAARLAGLPRVGLSPLVEHLLGLRLEKGYGAVDWSKRPLPPAWLTYAALDVEVLVELRDELEGILAAQDKLEWAAQEFEAVRTAPPPARRAEPWRRTSGIHRVRGARQLAAVRSLWEAREHVAADRDVAPGRVLPDAAIVEAVLSEPTDLAALTALPVFRGRAQRRLGARWWGALAVARDLPRAALPASTPSAEGPPPPGRWADKDPRAAARLAAARAELGRLAEGHALPVENLLAPDLVRRTCWEPPTDTSPTRVAQVLRAGGARPWQVELTAAALAASLAASLTVETSATCDGSDTGDQLY